MTIPIIKYMNQPIRRFEAIGIRHRVTLVEQQTAFPRLAFVIGKPRAHVHALRQSLGGRPILDKQNATGLKPTKEKACIDVLHRCGLLRSAPGPAVITGKTLKRLATGAGQHPESTIFQLDHHVLVKLPIREF